MLTISAMLVSLPAVTAHDPAWQVPTWTYVSISPEVVGVGQTVVVVFWQNLVPPTANGAYGDRWDFYVDVTKPDNSEQTLGPYTSDPVGGGYTIYTPDQVGTYTFVARFPGKILDNSPGGMSPSGTYSGSAMAEASNVTEFLGDYFLPSESEAMTLTVQQEQLQPYQETPLPTGYWTRPIYGANRDWWKVAGNWLGGAAQTYGPTNPFGYGSAPDSAHILWSRPYWDGGLMDTRFGSTQYYTGRSYESFSGPNIILNGKVYYRVSTPPRYGWYCIDLYSGETIYFQNTTGTTELAGPNVRNELAGFDNSGGLNYGYPSFGQIYNYESPNQHGGLPYLWVTSTGKPGTWDMLDAFTGNYICSFANVSASGTNVYGKDGSILYYRINNNRLTVWNTSEVIYNRWDWSTIGGNSYWMWRPYLNHTFDGNTGFSLNVSVPDLPGSIRAVREGEFIIGGTTGSSYGTPIEDGVMWALSLKPGEEGTLLWSKTFTPPQGLSENSLAHLQFSNRGLIMRDVDPEDGVFIFTMDMTRETWVYSLDTMQLLWKSDPEPELNFYGMSRDIYDGKLFTYGYSGVLTCYNIQTGEILWTWSAPYYGLNETPYQHTPLSLNVMADGKLYLTTNEHSPDTPLRRDGRLYCIDASSGELLFDILCWPGGSPIIADGRLVILDSFDNQIYCFGKGPSATTVAVKDDSVTKGESIMITGTVTDQTPDENAKGTPAISDESMTAWMEYLWHQGIMPEDAKGVTVKLYAIDPNDNYQNIGEVTSDIWGNYGKSWKPPVEGEYLIIAEFEGSAAYGDSSDSTYITVGPAVSAAQPIETEEPTAFALGTTELAIIAVAIIAAVGIVAFWMLRKRK